MTQKDDKKRGRDKTPALSDADRALWRQFTRDIDPLHPQAEETPPPAPPAPAAKKSIETPLYIPAPVYAPAGPGGADSRQLDRRTEDKLRRGKIEIEARIDLHGHSQDRAHDALSRFIDNALRRGLRCVLVITGKGRSSNVGDEWTFNDGVLRQRVPEWLSAAPSVLRCIPAQPRDGGDGAYYVYLRRHRD